MKWAAVVTLAVFAVAVVGWAQETEGPFVAPTPSPLPDFLELFDETWQERWVVSRQAKVGTVRRGRAAAASSDPI